MSGSHPYSRIPENVSIPQSRRPFGNPAPKYSSNNISINNPGNLDPYSDSEATYSNPRGMSSSLPIESSMLNNASNMQSTAPVDFADSLKGLIIYL